MLAALMLANSVLAAAEPAWAAKGDHVHWHDGAMSVHEVQETLDDCHRHHACHGHLPLAVSATAVLPATPALSVWSAPAAPTHLSPDHRPPVPPPNAPRFT